MASESDGWDCLRWNGWEEVHRRWHGVPLGACSRRRRGPACREESSRAGQREAHFAAGVTSLVRLARAGPDIQNHTFFALSSPWSCGRRVWRFHFIKLKKGQKLLFILLILSAVLCLDKSTTVQQEADCWWEECKSKKILWKRNSRRPRPLGQATCTLIFLDGARGQKRLRKVALCPGYLCEILIPKVCLGLYFFQKWLFCFFFFLIYLGLPYSCLLLAFYLNLTVPSEFSSILP